MPSITACASAGSAARTEGSPLLQRQTDAERAADCAGKLALSAQDGEVGQERRLVDHPIVAGSDVLAAIDVDLAAGDVGRGIAAQEIDRLGDLVGGTKAP